MTDSVDEPADCQVIPNVYDRLNAADPGERAAIVITLMVEHPEGRLSLPASNGKPARLGAVDLSDAILAAHLGQPQAGAGAQPARALRAGLCNANLQGADLRMARLEGTNLHRANLQGALLGGANLQGANLEEADLRGADMAGAQLQQAHLGEADLRNAMLEDVSFEGAVLRFAHLEGAVLEGADLRGADLWGAHLEQATLENAKLQGANLREATLVGANLTGAALRQATLGRANLERATLLGADFRDAALAGANLRHAVLASARLEEVDLSSCDITQIHLCGAWLGNTILEREQLGGAIGEECAGAYAAAAQGYLSLEQNFSDLRNPDSVRWAYLRRRRMQKLAIRAQGQRALVDRHMRQALRCYFSYISDQLVELLCDYGESISRVLRTLVVVYLTFTLIYDVTGSVLRVTDGSHSETHNPFDLAIFSLFAMTSTGTPGDLLPRSQMVQALTGLQVLMSIFLTGLLGFVAGNRIRR